MLVEHKCGWSEIGKIERTRVVVLAVDASLPAAVRSESQLPTAGIACKVSEQTRKATASIEANRATRLTITLIRQKRM